MEQSDKDKYVEKAIAWAEKRGFSNIKANYEGYETPKVYTKPEEDKPYVPDLTVTKTGGKSYVEVALKTDNIERRISKWKLLNTLAAMKGGKLFLLAPRGHKAFVNRMLKKFSLNATVVSI